MASAIGQPCVTGSLTQIIAKGSLCQFLKSDESTCFRTRYTRTTNFAAESSYQNFSGVTAFGSQANVVLQRQGDLVGNQYLVIDLPAIELAKVNHSTQPWVNAHPKTADDADKAVFEQHGKNADEGKKILADAQFTQPSTWTRASKPRTRLTTRRTATGRTESATCSAKRLP